MCIHTREDHILIMSREGCFQFRRGLVNINITNVFFMNMPIYNNVDKVVVQIYELWISINRTSYFKILLPLLVETINRPMYIHFV